MVTSITFKVRCKLIGFINGAERFPCHFDYTIGEEFAYNGERDEIYPPLYHVNVRLRLDELAEVGYIELRYGKAYPGNRAQKEKDTCIP